ncbi:BamA/TamA family outer membrane protein [Mongoliitalea daihaiensis]|uniref:BamA/TamA family outer membrane protein n=1 Tax=Mongoliitalea daihaiensis TaxID=2782006 RepID=UPI001F1726EA|nr:BamA/TamA family outer membrane protein [Mongoliitalea daihaiensis]UJP65708.1 BamA/TamA family outer membrane protein [Mongoliitalea daihaiensis]
MKIWLFSWGLFFFSIPELFSQELDSIPDTKRPVIEQVFDFGDQVINFISGEKWTIIPAVVYSPETSLGLGARALRIFRSKENPNLRPSTLPITFLYTLNNQQILTTELEWWANDNKSYTNARIELSNFPFKYFGIGNHPLSGTGESYTTQYASFHVNYEHMLLKGIYLGPRYEFRVDRISNRLDNGLLETERPIGFDGQLLSGLGLVLNHDTRDNIFQPEKGWFNRVSWMQFSQSLGSRVNFSQVTLDARKYITIKPQQVLAVQSWWSFTQGDAPFQNISLIGGSERMRGYFEGRFRDRHGMVQQAEYRFRIHRNLGMVAFVHAGQVASSLKDFSKNQFRYGAGIGFRYRLTPDGLNIRLDIAVGDQRAFYFGLNEVI